MTLRADGFLYRSAMSTESCVGLLVGAGQSMDSLKKCMNRQLTCRPQNHNNDQKDAKAALLMIGSPGVCHFNITHSHLTD